MSNTFLQCPAPRAIFFGMLGSFSLPSLQALLASGIEVCAVVLPAPHKQGEDAFAIARRELFRPARALLPVVHSSLHANIVQLAGERQIPVWEVQRLADPVTLTTLAAYEPDVICVACFSQRIPRPILDVPRFGCLNVHPSLLPANRGPVPLFWTFREGVTHTGVTIHLMDEGMDSGDMLAQERIDIHDGMTYAQLEAQCAARGGRLLADCVWKLAQERAVRLPQNEEESSYHPFPSSHDSIIPVAKWSARHVYNFICGLADWGESIILQVGEEHFAVQQVISYSHDTLNNSEQSWQGSDDRQDKQDKAYYWIGQDLWVRCNDGWVAIRT
jgi:methionyl-tRNA formyltransferase